MSRKSRIVVCGVVEHAEEHRWSSAQAHLGGRDEFALFDLAFWRAAGGADRWRQLLDRPEDQAERRQLRRATSPVIRWMVPSSSSNGSESRSFRRNARDRHFCSTIALWEPSRLTTGWRRRLA